MFLLITRVRCC